MKIAILLSLILVSGTFVGCATVQNRFHSKSKNLVSNDASSTSKDNPKYMDKVFSQKSVSISAAEKKTPTVNEDQSSSYSITDESRFKESMKDLETPVIVPSLGSPRYNIDKRVANNLPQTISDRDAYDVKYPTHKSYYDDKRVTIKDSHFEQTEDYLINTFSKAIQQGIEWKPDITKAEDFKNNKQFSVPQAPKFSKEALQTDVNYGELASPNSHALQAKSDPYNQIFPSK